ncbi:MAG: hypothetical protein H5T64_11295 [Chloroflexi bacterium]|nr:hypothetical protein [Chloroflexota bacterium]
MIDPAHLVVLRKIYIRLRNSNVNWALTGSFSLALQGVPVQVHDIDLQTDEAGAYEIERRFAEFVIQKVHLSPAERICSHFGALMMDGIKVEVMGDVRKRREDGTWEEAEDLERLKRVVEVEGMQIPVLSLDYEYQAYLALGRIEKAEMLRKWLYEDVNRQT